MQTMMAMQLEENGSKRRTALADRRHFTHKRLERWIRLQQFVYGLPDDYSYAVCLKESGQDAHISSSLVRVGWMCWFGEGRGVDKQHALAVSLLNTADALSANSTSVFLHQVKRIAAAVLGIFRRKAGKKEAVILGGDARERELLAG